MGNARTLILPTDRLGWVGRCLLTTVFGLAMAVWLASASAQPTVAQDTRQVIEQQLDAFKNDDGERAFSFATRNLQIMFESPDNFMTMVKMDYPVVYRPVSVSFLSFVGNEEEAIHSLQMVDSDKVLWNVVYTLQNTGQSGWKISGCQIKKAQAELI